VDLIQQYIKAKLDFPTKKPRNEKEENNHKLLRFVYYKYTGGNQIRYRNQVSTKQSTAKQSDAH
jgi:hypothetical protein